MIREILHFHVFCGIAGGAKGFNNAHARVGTVRARFRCLGGVDSDPSAIRDFTRIAGVPGTCLDLFDRDQYVAWHGHEPPEGWREAVPADLRSAAGNERPHVVFTSPPCKAFSGLLPESLSVSAKYQALNRLTVRGIWLTLEAWADDPPEFIIMENVPRIATRGAPLLGVIGQLLDRYGYVWADTTHDCGKLGGLAQSRKRFLRVARHREKVPPFLYEPEQKKLRAVGDVLGALPLPGEERGGPMHVVPRLTWKTWVRLAFVEAGSDWRSLNKLAVEDGYLRDYLIVPEMRAGVLGVNRWGDTAPTVSGRGGPTNGDYAVADPRVDGHEKSVQLGVRRWGQAAGVVTGKMFVGGGPNAVADPRHLGPAKYSNVFRIVPWGREARAITGAHGSGQCVADPRPACLRDRTGGYVTGGHYGVVAWGGQSKAVTAHPKNNNGCWSVADPRLPEASDQLACVIRALDGTWHRPFTTLELAALQGLVDPDEVLMLDGASHTTWREHIGNMVPPPAAQAIAGVMGTALLLAWAGQTFTLGMTPIWVRQVAVAAAVDVPLAGGAA